MIAEKIPTQHGAESKRELLRVQSHRNSARTTAGKLNMGLARETANPMPRTRLLCKSNQICGINVPQQDIRPLPPRPSPRTLINRNEFGLAFVDQPAKSRHVSHVRRGDTTETRVFLQTPEHASVREVELRPPIDVEQMSRHSVMCRRCPSSPPAPQKRSATYWPFSCGIGVRPAAFVRGARRRARLRTPCTLSAGWR